jgi:hypothetical protein
MQQGHRSVITGFSLEHFRAFGGRTAIPCAPVTLLFGKNSVGKTAALTALRALHQSYRLQSGSSVLDFEPGNGRISLGGPHNYFHRHDVSRPLRLGVSVMERGIDYEL